MEPDSNPERLSARLKGQYAPVYLTLTSIIQGVALSTLATRVEATSSDFGVIEWLLSATTFLVFLAVWNEYLLQVLAFVWVPTLLDSLVPFGFLGAELFLAHFVFHDLRAWLLALGCVGFIGTAASVVTETQVRMLLEENREIARLLAPHRRGRGVLIGALVALCFGAGALYDVARLGQAQLAIALVALGAVVGLVGSSVPVWNRLLAYARHETRAASPRREQERRRGRAQETPGEDDGPTPKVRPGAGASRRKGRNRPTGRPAP
jgi:hypothetical protein